MGFLPTLALVVATGIIGSYLVKEQGWRIWYDIQTELKEGRFPADKLIDGLLLVVAGVILIAPGLLTDTAGFVLLIPTSRNYFKQKLVVVFKKMQAQGRATVYTNIK